MVPAQPLCGITEAFAPQAAAALIARMAAQGGCGSACVRRDSDGGTATGADSPPGSTRTGKHARIWYLRERPAHQGQGLTAARGCDGFRHVASPVSTLDP